MRTPSFRRLRVSGLTLGPRANHGFPYQSGTQPMMMDSKVIEFLQRRQELAVLPGKAVELPNRNTEPQSSWHSAPPACPS